MKNIKDKFAILTLENDTAGHAYTILKCSSLVKTFVYISCMTALQKHNKGKDYRLIYSVR